MCAKLFFTGTMPGNRRYSSGAIEIPLLYYAPNISSCFQFPIGCSLLELLGLALESGVDMFSFFIVVATAVTPKSQRR